MRYITVYCEQYHRTIKHQTNDEDDAVRSALRLVDDALPRNEIFVVDLSDFSKVGYAFFGGDGGTYWHSYDKSRDDNGDRV